MRTSGSIALSASQNGGAPDALERYGARLAKFIRRRVPDRFDAEDILQDVLYEFVESGDTTHSIDQVGAWLFRVARSRIVDFFRKKKPERFAELRTDGNAEGGASSIEDLLPSPDAGPDAFYARGVLMRELADAIDDLPDEQRHVFIAHEIEGRSFKELAAETGVSVNTLLSRKHYAVISLRRRLEAIYEEFKAT
jgi:RNA polymerase sigma factor (sigma-70 family)